MNFGEKVKQLRAERNLTQPQLAQVIGIEQSYLSKLENDKSVPSADIFQAILRAFGIDVSTFLEGVDEKIVHRDLRQIPEVANHVNSQTTLRVHNIKAWLFSSALACVLGLSLGVVGWRGLLFSNTQYTYYSPGVIPTGEPISYFEKYDYLLMQRYQSGEITDKERVQRLLDVEKQLSPDHQVLADYRGDGFLEKLADGTRSYRLLRTVVARRPENSWLMMAGALLAFGGFFGFVVEARLRRIR